MDEKEYKVELEREKTKRELHHKIFWLMFWFMVIGGCSILELNGLNIIE